VNGFRRVGRLQLLQDVNAARVKLFGELPTTGAYRFEIGQSLRVKITTTACLPPSPKGENGCPSRSSTCGKPGCWVAFSAQPVSSSVPRASAAKPSCAVVWNRMISCRTLWAARIRWDAPGLASRRLYQRQSPGGSLSLDRQPPCDQRSCVTRDSSGDDLPAKARQSSFRRQSRPGRSSPAPRSRKPPGFRSLRWPRGGVAQASGRWPRRHTSVR
jgi:hypothetical protein